MIDWCHSSFAVISRYTFGGFYVVFVVVVVLVFNTEDREGEEKVVGLN